MQSLQIAVESRETGSVKSANAVRVLEQSVDQLEGEMRENISADFPKENVTRRAA